LLSIAISDALFQQFPKAREGDLSRLRSTLVRGKTLAELAREFELGDYLRLGEGELKSGGFRRDSILADAFEAIIGAVYLDSDFETCRALVLTWFASRLASISLENTEKDPKTRLQEYLQDKKKPLPEYTVVSIDGEAHSREFVVECRIGRDNLVTSASASSKRSAEKLAAELMLKRISDVR